MATMDVMTGDLERPTKSPSPLSSWTKVFPDPNAPSEANRNIFTILADEYGENSPRPPKPELSRLEAKGMVNLSSFWVEEDHEKMKNNAPNRMKNQKHQQQQTPIRAPFGVNSNSGEYAKNHKATKTVRFDYDEDLIIVTDKTTQTDQPWPFLRHPSVEDIRHGNDDTSGHSLNDNHDSSNSEVIDNNNDNNIHNNSSDTIDNDMEMKDTSTCNTNGKDLHQELTKDDAKESEAPTLKVEYVGKVWDAYVNDFLLASDHISEAAIYDKATKSCIACSLQFSLSEEEFDHLLLSLNNLSVAYKCGVKVNNVHLKTILADGRRGLMAKGEEHDGCSACQTRTLVLVAVHGRRAKGRRCNEELMRLGDFFWAKGL